MNEATRYIVTTVAGFALLALWVLSLTTPPILNLDSAIQAVLFLTGAGALGLTVRQGYTAASERVAQREAWEAFLRGE